MMFNPDTNISKIPFKKENTRNDKLTGYNTQITSSGKTGSTMITQPKSITFNLADTYKGASSNIRVAMSGSRKSSNNSSRSSSRQGPVPLVRKFKVTRVSNLNDSS